MVQRESSNKGEGSVEGRGRVWVYGCLVQVVSFVGSPLQVTHEKVEQRDGAGRVRYRYTGGARTVLQRRRPGRDGRTSLTDPTRAERLSRSDGGDAVPTTWRCCAEQTKGGCCTGRARQA